MLGITEFDCILYLSLSISFFISVLSSPLIAIALFSFSLKKCSFLPLSFSQLCSIKGQRIPNHQKREKLELQKKLPFQNSYLATIEAEINCLAFKHTFETRMQRSISWVLYRGSVERVQGSMKITKVW